MSNYVESEEEAEPFQSSGEDWDETKEDTAAKTRKSQRTKKVRTDIDYYPEDSDSDDFEEEESESDSDGGATKAKRKKNGMSPKKQKIVGDDEVIPFVPADTTTEAEPEVEISPEFKNGRFLIAKADLGKVEHKKMVLWRIDGKALLQKFEPFEDGEKLKHRNTSVYVGWSPQRQALYIPITVSVQKQQGQSMIVEFDFDTIKDKEKPKSKGKSKPKEEPEIVDSE